MRVLMLDNEFPPLGGGTGVINLHLLQEWAKRPDVWVDLVTSSRTKKAEEREQFAERIWIYKVPVDNQNIHHSSNRELIRYFLRGYRLSRRLARYAAYDVGFAYSAVPAGAIGLGLRAQMGLPYLVFLQGPDIPGYEARYRNLYPFLKPMLQLIWRRAACVTASSEFHRDLAYKTRSASEIVVVPNGVDADLFTPRDRPQQGPVNLVCVGRLIERKGQHHLLKAAALLKERSCRNWRVTLVGTGDAEPALREQAAALGISAEVTFMGVVGRAEMPMVYQGADVFVLPSENEGMSVALLEAMACGLPAVVTMTGGTKELIDGNGLIVPWADSAALADTLQRLITDGLLRRSMGQRSREIACRYAWPAYADHCLSLCRSAAKSGGSQKARSR